MRGSRQKQDRDGRFIRGAAGKLFRAVAMPALEGTMKVAIAAQDAIYRAKARREAIKQFTPLELAPYRFSCAVNSRSTSVPDGVIALMKEIGAKEASIYLKRDGETGLAHYLTTDGRNVFAKGSLPNRMVQETFDEGVMKICVPRKKGAWPPSRMHTATMVPDDITFTKENTWRCNDHWRMSP